MLLATLPADPIVVEAYPTGVMAHALSPDRRFAATLAQDGTLDVWAIERDRRPSPTAHLLFRLRTPPWPDWDGGAPDFVAVSPTAGT